MYIIAARKLTKYYGSLCALDNVDFVIKKGECFGFLGPNGAGKTTAMGIIYCFINPSSGELTVSGMDVTRSPEKIKSITGVMPQDNNLDPDLSTVENLLVYARFFGISHDTAVERAYKLLDFVELRKKSDINIRDLSGGMQRRLTLARSLINDPEILILDEPTNGLDPHSRRSVWQQLNSLKRENITLVLTTHYMEEAEKLCDRVAIMDLGKIVAVDSPSNLMNIHGGNLEDVYLKITGKRLDY